jgi:cytochrome c553
MAASCVRARSALLAAIIAVALPAAAQNRSATAASSGPTALPLPLPQWAYPANSPDFKPGPDDGSPRRVPDSAITYTLSQLRDRFFAPDWHPGDHPLMPDIVARGRKPGVFACGHCHRADGPGGPESSSLAGLSADYIVKQMADYKSGERKSSVPQRAPVQLMISLAHAVTGAEIEEAAEYFSALKPKANIKVVETDTVPKTYVAGWFLAAMNTGEKEPIGQRIIEVPEDLEQFNNHDSRARFIAYVPTGSIARGEALVKSGGDNSVTCALCHGVELRGSGPVPGIAGRSPSYVVRQLYDFKSGAWGGFGGVQMKPYVEKLGAEDIVALAAYLATLAP